MFTLPDGVGTGAAEGDPAAGAGAEVGALAVGDFAADGCWLPCGDASSQMPRPTSTTTTTPNTAFCWPGDRSMVRRYFFRRTGRSQNGIGISGRSPWAVSRSAWDGAADRGGGSSPDSAP